VRIKLILGLTAGLMSVAQIGSAQAVFTGVATDAIFANTVVGYFEVISATADDTASSDIAASGFATSDTVPFTDFESDKNSSDGSTGIVSLNLADTTPQNLAATDSQTSPSMQAVGNGVARQQSKSGASVSDNAFNWAADGNWLSFGSGSLQQGLAAVGNDSALLSSSASSDVDFSTTAKSLGNSPLDAIKASKGSGGGAPLPMIASPEPGTVELLVLGGAALGAGAVCRRKRTA
jgi:hypothetical protein